MNHRHRSVALEKSDSHGLDDSGQSSDSKDDKLNPKNALLKATGRDNGSLPKLTRPPKGDSKLISNAFKSLHGYRFKTELDRKLIEAVLSDNGDRDAEEMHVRKEIDAFLNVRSQTIGKSRQRDEQMTGIQLQSYGRTRSQLNRNSRASLLDITPTKMKVKQRHELGRSSKRPPIVSHSDMLN